MRTAVQLWAEMEGWDGAMGSWHGTRVPWREADPGPAQAQPGGSEFHSTEDKQHLILCLFVKNYQYFGQGDKGE